MKERDDAISKHKEAVQQRDVAVKERDAASARSLGLQIDVDALKKIKTGSAEIMLWGETFVPARDAGLLESGKIIKLKCAIQVDDRTGSRRLTGYEIAELKPKRALANGKGPLELMLWTSRHSERDLEEIQFIIAGYPGHTPVHLHFQNSAGRRLTVEMGAAFNVKRSVELEDELARWIEE